MGAIPPSLPPRGPAPLGDESDKQKALDLIQKIQEEIDHLKNDVELGSTPGTLTLDIHKILDLSKQLEAINLPAGLNAEKTLNFLKTVFNTKEVNVNAIAYDEGVKEEFTKQLASLKSGYDQLFNDIKKS